VCPMTSVIAAATWSAPCPYGRCSSRTNRVARSTSVLIADLPPAPRIRSPSQCPGTARSFASAGRSLIITMPGGFPRRSRRLYAAACVAPGRCAAVPPARGTAPSATARRWTGRSSL
jgi:hypothetical protein